MCFIDNKSFLSFINEKGNGIKRRNIRNNKKILNCITPLAIKDESGVCFPRENKDGTDNIHF